MLEPSYSELMDVLNEKTNDKNEVTSRYTIVIAAAKRARQIIDGDEPMIEVDAKSKPVSTAVGEIRDGKLQVVEQGKGTVLDIYTKKNENKNIVRDKDDDEDVDFVLDSEKEEIIQDITEEDFAEKTEE